MKVLIVDDTRVNRMVLARMAKKLGIGSFSHAVDGRDAVQQAQAGDFDVIFMVRQGTCMEPRDVRCVAACLTRVFRLYRTF